MNVCPRVATAVLLLSALAQGPLAAAETPLPPAAQRPARFFAANYEVTISVERAGGRTEHRMVAAMEDFGGTFNDLKISGELFPQADGAVVLEFVLEVYEVAPASGRPAGSWRSAVRLAAGQAVEVARSGGTVVRLAARPLR